MKKIYLLIPFALCVLFCGCNGYREIDRGYLVTAIGFSTQNNTTNIFIEALSSSDVTDEKNKKMLLTGSGADEMQAYKNLKDTLVKPLYFEQLGTAVFENTLTPHIDFLKEIPNINPGIYIIKTDNINAIFEGETPNGVLGYDVIALIKTQQKEKSVQVLNQLYKAQNINFELPIVNFVDGKLTLKQTENNQ